MRKNTTFFLFCLSAALLLAGCSKEPPERTNQDFSVAVYHRAAPDGMALPATPLWVYLFEDTGRAIDYDRSAQTVRESGVMTFADGSSSQQGLSGVGVTIGLRVFPQIPNGKYLVWAVYNIRNMDYMASSLAVEVDDDIQGKILLKVFSGSEPGYQDWANER